jgi:hypothetical protein
MCAGREQGSETRELASGRIGKLLVFKSGKVKMQVRLDPTRHAAASAGSAARKSGRVQRNRALLVNQ